MFDFLDEVAEPGAKLFRRIIGLHFDWTLSKKDDRSLQRQMRTWIDTYVRERQKQGDNPRVD